MLAVSFILTGKESQIKIPRPLRVQSKQNLCNSANRSVQDHLQKHVPNAHRNACKLLLSFAVTDLNLPARRRNHRLVNYKNLAIRIRNQISFRMRTADGRSNCTGRCRYPCRHCICRRTAARCLFCGTRRTVRASTAAAIPLRACELSPSPNSCHRCFPTI